MADQWYYAEQGQRKGPVPEEQLRQLAASGHLEPTAQVWKNGMDKWVPASNITGLFPDGPPPLISARKPAALHGREALQKAQEQVEKVSSTFWFLDLKFTQFATPKLVGFVYAVYLLLVVLGVITCAVRSFILFPAWLAAAIIVASILLAFLGAVAMRVFLELFLVMFRIAERLEPLGRLENLQYLKSHTS